jgi:magnesium-transporting ATPase (P-type)
LQADVATVLRGKRLMVLPACDLVPGDIVEIAGPFPLICPRVLGVAGDQHVF